MPPQHHSKELVAEREALEEMLRSEGWAIFSKRVYSEFSVGPGYYARMGKALAGDDPIEPKVVHKVCSEVQNMLQWPINRVKALKGVVE